MLSANPPVTTPARCGAGRVTPHWLPWGLLLLLLLAASGAARAEGIEVVLSEDGGAYAELAERLQAEFPRRQMYRHSAAVLEREGINGRSPEVVVALGTRALSAALTTYSVPVIAALVPGETFDRLARTVARPKNAQAASGVYLDQPPRRRLNLVRLTLPGKTRIGVLVSPEHEPQIQPLRETAADLGLRVVSEQPAAAPAVYPALSRILADVDVVLAVPDATVFNSGNIHNILLATYRARVPLLGFSGVYVQAGALAAVYSTPRQIAPQLIDLIQRALAGRSLPPAQHPKVFTVGVNHTVARSLGLALEEAAILEARLAALEMEP